MGAETLLTPLGVQGTYVDSAVVTGTTYWYQVVAVNAVGPSARSNERSATPPPPPPPTAPGAPNLTAATAGNASVALTLDGTGLRRWQPDHRLPGLARHDQRRRQPADHRSG